MPDYKTNDPRGWCGDPSRGAALGRPTRRGAGDFNGAIFLRRKRINQGGYDDNGTYFGHGPPLYWFAADDDDIDGMLRATNREDARNQVLAMYPKAKVRR